MVAHATGPEEALWVTESSSLLSQGTMSLTPVQKLLSDYLFALTTGIGTSLLLSISNLLPLYSVQVPGYEFTLRRNSNVTQIPPKGLKLPSMHQLTKEKYRTVPIFFIFYLFTF